MAAMRDTASLRFSTPVDGTAARRTPRSTGQRRTPSTRVTGFRVDPRVMAVAKKAQRPGEKLVIVSTTEVRFTNGKQ